LDISEDGVLLSKKGQEKEDVKESAKTSESNNQPGTRAVRATTKGRPTTDQSDANPTSVTPNGASNGAPNGATSGAGDNQTTTPTRKSADPKKEDKKDSKKKEKKGFLGGIFK
jgi:hypothetical protein